MDVINRLKTAVTNVLPVGNPITNDFELLLQRASGGPAMCWKIYDGLNKTSKKQASIFIFEKKWLDRFHTKRDKEMFIEMLKRGVLQLTKLRHPKILSVVHPLEDSRESLAFATEPLYTSLSNVLGQHDNLPNPPPAYLKDFSLFDVETKYGLLQVIEALSFLHKSAKIMHGNLSQESVFINRLGTWKLAGFEHCILNSNAQGEAYFAYREFNQLADPLTQPKLPYLAPEYGLSGCCDVSSDIFSLGVLLYAFYNNNNPLNNSSIHDWESYKLCASELRNLKAERLTEVPDGVREVVRLMLNIDPALRPDADQLSKTAYFDDVGVVTLTYLDLLVQKDNLQKSQFFKDLAPVVAKLPKRVNLQRVVPSLANEASNNNMVPFLLPTLFQIANTTSNEEYQRYIFPVFIPLLKLTEPVQVMLLFLQHMELMLSKSSQNDIRNHLLSLVSRALEVNIPQIQDLCLRSISTFATIAESSSVKNTIVPKMLRLAQSQAPLSIRVNCLVCLGKMLEHLDRWYVIDDVIPAIMAIQSREPAMLMSELGIFKTALSHAKLGLSKEVIACKLLPHLFPLAIDNSLNLKQFNAYMSVVKEMTQKVETEHRSKLQQLDSVEEEQKSLQRFAQEVAQENSTSTKTPSATDSLSFLDTPITKPVRTEKKNLTMEEKEAMARQQELEMRFNTGPALLKAPFTKPPSSLTPLSSSSSSTLPKDLTQSLIDSNLCSMSNIRPHNSSLTNHQPSITPNYQPFNHQPSNQPFNHQPSNQPFNHQPSNQPFNHQPSNQPFNHQPSNQPFNHQPSTLSTYPPISFNHQPSTLSTNPSNSSSNHQASMWSPQSIKNQKTRIDTSVFDSIDTGLVSRSTNKNQPLAAMTTSLSSMKTNQPSAMNLNSLQSDFFAKNSIQSKSTSTSNNQSTLSTQDIQDFLG